MVESRGTNSVELEGDKIALPAACSGIGNEGGGLLREGPVFKGEEAEDAPKPPKLGVPVSAARSAACMNADDGLAVEGLGLYPLSLDPKFLSLGLRYGDAILSKAREGQGWGRGGAGSRRRGRAED